MCFSYFILYLSNFPYLYLQIIYRWFVISQSGGHSSHMMASSITWISLIPSKQLQRIGSRLGSRRLGQALPIKHMINSRWISTSIRQGSYWIWGVGRFIAISTSGRSSLSSIYLAKTFLPKFGQINLLLSTFILVTVFIFLSRSRILRHMLRQERQIIFGTTRGFIIMPCRLFGKYDGNRTKRENVYYWLIFHGDPWW